MRATMAEQIAINAKLQEVCKAIEGMAIYAEGWDDARVAAEVAPRLNKHHVMYVRKEMGFGKLRQVLPKDATRDIIELQAIVVQLVRDFDNQAKHLAILAQRVKALESVSLGQIKNAIENVEPIRKV